MLRAVQEEFPINCQGRSYSQALARTVVDFIGNGIELLLAVDRQVCALWQVLAHQPVHVLIGATLPGAMRVAKVHSNARVLTELFVHRHLPALVIGHALAQRLGNAQQLVREALQHIGRTGGLNIGQLDQHQQAAGAVNQSAHRAGVGPALNQVALPVARKQAIFNLWGTQMDAEYVRNVPPSILPFAARHALVACVAQGLDQVLLEFANGLGIDAVVDGFV